MAHKATLKVKLCVLSAGINVWVVRIKDRGVVQVSATM